jgi:hypothetical protein
MAAPEYFVSIKLLNCRNLPKADVIGKIDPYVKFDLQRETIKSSTKKTDYNPDYNENIGSTKSLPVGATVNVEVWDWDSIGKDDKVAWASFQVQPGYRQYHNLELTLKKGMKGHHGNSTISFDVVALRTPAGLGAVPGAVTTLFSEHSATALVRGHEGDALVKIEFEKGRVDVKAYSLREKKYVSLGYGLPNFEYKIRFQRFLTKQPLGGNLFAYSEAKLDDIPADFRLDLVKIYIGDENIAEHTNLDNVASEHGWSGSLTYKDAKKTLRNIGYDDKSETVFMPANNFVTKIDWDSKNVDFAAFLYDKTQKESKIVEMTAAGHLKQTHTYFAQPKPVGGTTALVTMKASVDDVKYGIPNEDIHISVYQLSNVQAVTFTDIFPVYA